MRAVRMAASKVGNLDYELVFQWAGNLGVSSAAVMAAVMAAE